MASTGVRGVGHLANNRGPSIKEISLGGGFIEIAELGATGQPGAFRDLGTTQEVTVTVNTESYEHSTPHDGAPAQDLSVIIDSGASLTFSMDNMSAENMALFLLGTASAYTNPGIAGVTISVIALDGQLQLGGTYQIQDSNGNPVFGITSTNALAVSTTEGTPVALAKDTDYTVDEDSGRITIAAVSTKVSTAIGTGDGLSCVMTADGTATAVDLVTLLTDIEKDVALTFTQINASDNNDKTYWHFHKVSMAANGDANLISTEAGQLPMTATVEVNDYFTNRADIYTPDVQVNSMAN
jgi:hypothetical protein